MLQVQVGNRALNFGLIVIDMQNGFVSRGGSYDTRLTFLLVDACRWGLIITHNQYIDSIEL